MKTDKFDDAIRRKLESIEPAFRERDWGHMQAFMHRHGYPPTWTGAPQWLLPMAAAATVTVLLISTIWQFRTNQELRQSVQTLSQTVARLEATQSQLIQLKTKTDTVYVTTSTPSAVPSSTNQPIQRQSVQPGYAQLQPGRLTPVQPQNPDTRMPLADRSNAETGTKTRPTAAPAHVVRQDRFAAAQPGAGQPNRQSTDESIAGAIQPGAPASGVAAPMAPSSNPATPTTDLTPAAGQTDRQTNRLTETANLSDHTAPAGNYTGPVGNRRTDALATNRTGKHTTVPRDAARQTGERGSSPSQPIREGASTSRTDQTGDRHDGQSVAGSAAIGTAELTTRETVNVPLLSSRPLSLDSAYYVESIAKRIRRIRSLFPAVAQPVQPVAQAMPTEAASSRPRSGGVHLRLGASGEISTLQHATGAYSEVLIGRHWSLGVGLEHVRLENGQFADDQQFDSRTAQDFRKKYAPGIDPRHPILDINRQLSFWQVPVSLNYRLLLNHGFALVPSAGMNFVTSTQENTTFVYRRGPYEVYNANVTPSPPPCNLFTSFVVAFGAEKSWHHFVLQAAPVLTTPTKQVPDPINPVSLGIRARVLFQF